ncbi:hypothetical protein [Salinisphaera sp. T31B1]|uniref:hypothetical protein n=1 Tax=Salinisphaera sp. T31B1 TaxID=727963 RepID=UPI00333EA6BB
MARNRLWRCTDPSLDETERTRLVKQLMDARRAVKHAETEAQRRRARGQVDQAKIGLGERGPVWWSDGAEDESRRKPDNTRYAQWWADLPEAQRRAGES